MKVILLKNVPKVGNKYDVKNVSDGHALNFMIPKGLAEIATPQAIRRVEQAKITDAEHKKVTDDLLAKNIDDIKNIKIEIEEKASEKGHLFKGVHKEELIEEIKKQTRLDISPEFIILEKPIKIAGEHDVEVKAGNKSATFKVIITATK